MRNVSKVLAVIIILMSVVGLLISPLFFLGIALGGVIFVLSTKQQPKPKEETKPTEEKPKYKYVISYLNDAKNEDRFVKAYKPEFEENDDYHLSAKELKEDFYDEKVYRYMPFELPYKIHDQVVYSQIGDEWLEVGKLKKGVKLDDFATFYLYPNEYKYVTEDSVEKENDGAYFGFYYKKPIE